MKWNGRPIERDEVPGFARAFALVMDDLERTWSDGATRPSLELELLNDDNAGQGVSVRYPDRAWHANGGIPPDLYPKSGPDPVAAVADAAQETIAEFDEALWPVCSVHNRGLHPRSIAEPDDEDWDDWAPPGPAVWWCSAEGGHAPAEIGQLGVDA